MPYLDFEQRCWLVLCAKVHSEWVFCLDFHSDTFAPKCRLQFRLLFLRTTFFTCTKNHANFSEWSYVVSESSIRPYRWAYFYTFVKIQLLHVCNDFTEIFLRSFDFVWSGFCGFFLVSCAAWRSSSNVAGC